MRQKQPLRTATPFTSRQGGSDTGDGSAAKPLQTIGAALKKAGGGDTIELANGTYREGELAVDKGVTIKAAEGAKPVLTAPSPRQLERRR